MSFNPSIPTVNDLLAISQKQLLANFQAIYNSFSQNHAKLGSSNQGQHNSLTFRSVSVDPATGANQSALYNKLDGSSVPQLFFRPSSNQTPIQMTNSNLNLNYGNQSSFLPGPFTIYTGFRIGIANNALIVLTPATTLVYVGLSTINGGPPGAIPVNIVGNQFNVQYPSLVIPTTSIYYFAIGSS